MELINLFWLAWVSSSDDGGGLFDITLFFASFRHAGAGTLVGGASLVGLGRDATMSAGSSKDESEGVLYLVSGYTVRVSTSLFGGRGGGVQSEEEGLVFHQLFVGP